MASLCFYNLVLFTCMLLSSLQSSVLCVCKNPPIIFNFGDSNSDTGGLVSGLGFPINLPNGRSFFRRSTGRLSDGRLIIDFLCEYFFLPIFFLCILAVCSNARFHNVKYYLIRDCGFVSAGQSVNSNFLSPYLDSMGAIFSNGVNFAVVGSATLPRFIPFALHIQVMQFLHFKDRSVELVTAGNIQ